MDNRKLVVEWLEKHQAFDIKEVEDGDYTHLVNILKDVADFSINKTVSDSAKWIRENVSDAVAVDYLRSLGIEHKTIKDRICSNCTHSLICLSGDVFEDCKLKGIQTLLPGE